METKLKVATGVAAVLALGVAFVGGVVLAPRDDCDKAAIAWRSVAVLEGRYIGSNSQDMQSISAAIAGIKDAKHYKCTAAN